MRLKNTRNSYGVVAKMFHWVLFLLIAGMVALGFIMTGMANGPDKFRLIGLHKSIGITVLALAGLRLLWKLANVAPALPAALQLHEKFLAHAGHGALYLLMLALPLSGWAMSSAAAFPVSVFGWFVLPDLVAPNAALKATLIDAHGWLAWAMIAMVSLHVLAALLHHFYYKDNVLTRMLPFAGEKNYATDLEIASDTVAGR